MAQPMLVVVFLFAVYSLELYLEKKTKKMIPLFGATLVVLMLPLYLSIGLGGQLLYAGLALALIAWWGAACWVADWWDGGRHPR